MKKLWILQAFIAARLRWKVPKLSDFKNSVCEEHLRGGTTLSLPQHWVSISRKRLIANIWTGASSLPVVLVEDDELPWKWQSCTLKVSDRSDYSSVVHGFFGSGILVNSEYSWMSWVCLMQNKEVIAVARQQRPLLGSGEIQYCLVWFSCQVSLANREYIMSVSPQHL